MRRTHGKKRGSDRTCCDKDASRVQITFNADRVTCPGCRAAIKADDKAHPCPECDGDQECQACEGCGEHDNDETCETCKGRGDCSHCKGSGVDPEHERVMET